MAKQDLLDMKAKQLEEKEKDVKKLQRKLQRQTPVIQTVGKFLADCSKCFSFLTYFGLFIFAIY